MSDSRATVRVEPHEAVTPSSDNGSMTTQLNLLREEDDWRLDERTREAGRRGVAEARRILAETVQRSAHQALDHRRVRAA